MPPATTLKEVGLDTIRSAARTIRSRVARTPLVRLEMPEDDREIYLKLESLQPTGSFKVRGAATALARLSRARARRGVYTGSAGNMAQALAWAARGRDAPCTVLMPEGAPETKLAGVRRWGAEVVQLPWASVWEALERRSYPPLEKRTLVHPFSDPGMVAGNGTIGLEIVHDLPDVDTVLVPLGGGGLAAGVAIAVGALRPEARVLGCEPETAAPFAAAFRAGGPVPVTRTPSFVDGAGGSSVFPEMWELLHGRLGGSVVVGLSETADAIRFLVERKRVVAEGAAGLTVAAALGRKVEGRKIVCVVSGGNIDTARLTEILRGAPPG